MVKNGCSIILGCKGRNVQMCWKLECKVLNDFPRKINNFPEITDLGESGPYNRKVEHVDNDGL